MPYCLACVEDLTDPVKGMFKTVATEPGGLGAIEGVSNVFAMGRPVATVGMVATPHGNFTDPKLPGYNPTCATAIITGFRSAYNVLVNGKPAAVTAGATGTMLSCTHFVAGPGAPTVIVGDTSVC